MKLPYCKNVVIPNEKLTEYVLSRTHPVGKHKAVIFHKKGYDETKIGQMQQDLQAIVRVNEVSDMRNSDDGSGKNYTVIGKIKTPIGSLFTIKTVWFIKKNSHKPRFITAYPV
jgi:hypothetical protein